MPDLPRTLDHLNEISLGHLPGFVGVEVLLAEPGRLTARMAIRQELMAPNGYLHAASVIALADTACGYGTMVDLPAGNAGFTTIELKTNFVGTSRQGALRCEATRLHGGKSTQVWDAVVQDETSGRAIAFFRCTQMLLKAK